MTEWHFNFNWTEFDENSLAEVRHFEKEMEDNIYGFLPFSINGEYYLADIHYYYYGSDDYGFDIELYESDENGEHKAWLEGLKGIRTATNYKRFCRRVEDLIIEYFRTNAARAHDTPSDEDISETGSLPGREIETLMHLSTAHITPATFEWLIKVNHKEPFLFPFMLYEKTWSTKTGRITTTETTGFFVHITDAVNLDEYDWLPNDLKSVLQAVIKEQVNWLILDHDAPHASDYEWPAGKNLPVYEWHV